MLILDVIRTLVEGDRPCGGGTLEEGAARTPRVGETLILALVGTTTAGTAVDDETLAQVCKLDYDDSPLRSFPDSWAGRCL